MAQVIKTKPAPKKGKKVEAPKVTKTQIKKIPTKEVLETPELPNVDAVVETPVETPKTFIEKMLIGLKQIEVQGGRTLYVKEGEKEFKLEIVGEKLFNKGLLREGWTIQLSSGSIGKLVNVDETKAIIKSSSLDTSISARSEVEIIDPEFKAEKVAKPEYVKTEQGEIASEKPAKQQYAFNGQVLSKSFLAREIVAKYVLDNPKSTLKTLDEKFPAPFMGKYGIFKEITEAKKISGNGLARYFFKPEQLIKVGDKNIAICNQITEDKINSIIAIAKTLGYEDIKTV